MAPLDLPDEATEDLTAAGWNWSGIRHGFGKRGQPVAIGFRLARARQVHGVGVAVVDRGTSPGAGEGGAVVGEADALITDLPGVAVAVATADCVPILIAVPDRPAGAAVHAGWRGTLAGITSTVLDAMRDRYRTSADQVRVALGPSIGGCCYEIETELASRFADRFGAAIWSCWHAGPPGKGKLDLRGVNRIVLRAAGVPAESIQDVGPCTACGGGRFASFRAEGPGAARQLSWIGLA